MKYLQPHKLKPLNKDILIVAKYLYSYLKIKKNVKLEKVLSYLKKEMKINEKHIILAINFLYSFDKIYYDPNRDIIGLK